MKRIFARRCLILASFCQAIVIFLLLAGLFISQEENQITVNSELPIDYLMSEENPVILEDNLELKTTRTTPGIFAGILIFRYLVFKHSRNIYNGVAVHLSFALFKNCYFQSFRICVLWNAITRGWTQCCSFRRVHQFLVNNPSSPFPLSKPRKEFEAPGQNVNDEPPKYETLEPPRVTPPPEYSSINSS